jgi:murein DD-endopeptidase MepM/ murein hydrolase activator NlpD
MIKLKHCSTYSSAYLHLSKFAKSIHNGKKVTRGEVIGYVGMTGSATGPHLHFSLYKHGKYVDLMKVDLPRMPAFSDPLSKAYLNDMLKELKAAQAESLKLRLASNQPVTSQVG